MKRTLSILMSVIMTFTFFCSSITVEATENETENSAVENDISINGKNSFGQLMSEILTKEQDRQENNNGFNVFSAEVTGNTVTAEYEVLESCTMITAIYDEDGVQMITSGKTEVTPEENYTEVTIETDVMPQYFYLRIFLVDSQTLSPLCTAYESPNYTREMQDFFSKTTGDFEEERVLNLDDDNSNNFAVFNEDIIISQSDDNLNTVVSADDENGIYILENVDETVSGLENGDIFSCQYGEDNILIAKVGEIEIDGTTAVITSEDTSLDAVFDYVKINSSSELSDADIDYDSMDEGIEYIGTENNNSRMISGTEGENTLTGDTLTLEIASKKIGKLKLSGSLSLSSEVSVKTYISLKYQYFELKVENKLGFKISLSGSATSPAIVKLPPIDFSPVPGLYVGIQPALQIKFSGDISFTGGIKSSIGFNYDSDRGFKNISSKPEPDDMTISAEAKLFLGLIIEPRIVILHEKIAKAGFKCTSGVEITAKLKKKIGDYDSTHECNLCIDGDTSAKTELSCELTFFGLDNLTWEHKFADWSLKLNEFYYSIDKKEFGWGSCPYDKHKIKVKVIVGGNDHPCENAHVSYGKESCITASDGIADLLISDGYHTITVSCDNCETVQQKIYVNGDDKDITVHLWAIDPAKTTTATTVRTSGSTQTVTTTTVPAEQPDENGYYVHNGVIYKCYDDYAVVAGHNNDLPADVTLLKEVCGLPVTLIATRAFYDAGELVSLKIPDTVTIIGKGAFHYCFKLTDITLPDSITEIKPYSFGYCRSLTNIYVDSNNSNFCDINGVVFNKDKTILVQYPTGKNNSSYTIPDTVETIGEYAFITCEALESLIIPESVTSIGQLAFSYSSIKTLYIPTSVKLIDDRALDNTSLTDIYYSGTESQWNEINMRIGNKLTDITIHFNSTGHDSEEKFDENGEYIHDGVIYTYNYDCAWVSGYTENLPDNVTLLKEVCGLPVTYISNDAFKENEKITSVIIPDSIIDIGCYSFTFCSNLKSIKIPDSVTSIGMCAFEGCDSLTSITIPNSVTGIQGSTFQYCKNLKSVTLPDSITSIGGYAFNQCTNLESITIPKNVTSIGDMAFSWCNKLTDVYYSGTESEWNAITIGDENDCLTNATIHYNSTAPAPTPAPPVMKPDNESFADLKPNKLYNFYAFKDKNAVDKLSAENFIYIAQFTTDENGNADIPYIPENDQILITEATYSIATADISIGDVVYTGSEVVPDIVVTRNGTQLTEGVDYETESDLSAINIGSYRILIKGTGEFSGYADVIYNVICSHNFADGICTICGDKKPETDVSKIILGDVNEDGMVNAIDATAVLEEYANLSTDRNGTFSDYQKLSGDINSDNMIDAVDASFILEFYAYLSTDGTESDMRVWLDIK